MRNLKYAAATIVLAGATVTVPSIASASPSGDSPEAMNQCRAAVEHAVWEDMDSYNKRDADRYGAILDKEDMVAIDRRGNVIAGWEANTKPVFDIQFKLPYEWSLPWTVTSVHVPNCQTGTAVLDAHYLAPSLNIDRHYTLTLVIAKKHGEWKVVQDTSTLVNPAA
jgi:ketosteroid isomerase-like protein